MNNISTIYFIEGTLSLIMWPRQAAIKSELVDISCDKNKDIATGDTGVVVNL